jgi:hypothetical protein
MFPLATMLRMAREQPAVCRTDESLSWARDLLDFTRAELTCVRNMPWSFGPRPCPRVCACTASCVRVARCPLDAVQASQFDARRAGCGGGGRLPPPPRVRVQHARVSLFATVRATYLDIHLFALEGTHSLACSVGQTFLSVEAAQTLARVYAEVPRVTDLMYAGPHHTMEYFDLLLFIVPIVVHSYTVAQLARQPRLQ